MSISPEENIDPEEMVSAPHLQGGAITMRKAVRKTMAMPPFQQGLVEIFRSGQPEPLTINDIRILAERPEFQSEAEIR
jgi:hypothetical protein